MMKLSGHMQRNLFIIVVCLFAITGFVFAASVTFRTGFPLDDAWIHQTFARNLVQFNEWSFNPGEPTSGSTSPLWTLLLSPAFFLNIPPVAWALILGGLFFCLTVILIKAVAERFVPMEGAFLYITAVAVTALEWHLIWAAASGMETILFCFLLTLVLYLTIGTRMKPFLIGLAIGTSIWVRPEGITLLGPVMLILIYSLRKDWKALSRNTILVLCGLLILLTPYLYFNYHLSGSLWPNTLAAKQLEYQGLLNTNGFLRYMSLFTVPMIGGNILLFPGFIYAIYSSFRKKEIRFIAFAIWLFGFVLMYSLNLPVTYQHGRYLIPIIPIYLSLSIPGLFQLFGKIRQKRGGFVIQMVWSISILLVSAGFGYLGAKAYANDVAVIETEMVEPSKWISNNTPADSRIAAHDIGALGYFGNRYVIDLAGLVNKEVVPILTDPIGLRNFLNETEADYLMIFPNWYSSPLVPETRSVFTGKYDYALRMGGERMEIYRFKIRKPFQLSICFTHDLGIIYQLEFLVNLCLWKFISNYNWIGAIQWY